MMRNSASTRLRWRKFAMRNISAGRPLKGAMTIDLLNKIRAVGRENRTKMRPVMTASQEHAGNDFNDGKEVTIERLRIHVAVADGGQRLHTEKESVEK